RRAAQSGGGRGEQSPRVRSGHGVGAGGRPAAVRGGRADAAPALVHALRGRGPRGGAAVVAGLARRPAGRDLGPGGPEPARGDSRLPPGGRRRGPGAAPRPGATGARGTQVPVVVAFLCRGIRNDSWHALGNTPRRDKSERRMMNTHPWTG